MKKNWLIPIIIIGTLGSLYFVGQITGALKMYKIPTLSNEPTIKKGDRILVSNLVSPKRFDFICFKQEKGEYWEGGTWLMRLCGLPGDKIQIIDGTLFVNGQNADSRLNLKKKYILPGSELKKISESYYRNHTDEVFKGENDSVVAMLETDVFKNKSLSGRMKIAEGVDQEINKIYGQPWNTDNFGPIIVPDKSFFVLGDNRHGAADSRYTGFIKADNYIGTVLSRK